VSAIYIKTYPEIDSDACSRGLPYPEEASQLGIEGNVKLKVVLDDRGKVLHARVVKGLGHGLDELALNALRNRRECKFSPAIGTDGKPAAFELDYTFVFELNR
jgi:protein TonB